MKNLPEDEEEEEGRNEFQSKIARYEEGQDNSTDRVADCHPHEPHGMKTLSWNSESIFERAGHPTVGRENSCPPPTSL